MLNNLIEKIKEGSRLRINGKEYNVLTKSIYSPLSDVNLTYAKFVLSTHKILVVVPYADFLCIGHIENVFGDGKDFPETIAYNGQVFNKLDEDYQIVRHLVFGNPMIAEGEVAYADYSNESSNICISLGLISKDNTRADIIQTILSIDDIQVE